MNDFSVLISLYDKELDCNLDSALRSIFNQSLKPSEVILVLDGPINSSLQKVIELYTGKYDSLKLVKLDKNVGLGEALRVGLEYCSYELVARMDTDDICLPNRFEKQIKFIINNPQLDVVGCNIEEFNKIPGDLNRFKINPEYHSELIKQIKLKSPFNHPTIVFKKKLVLDVGNYNGDLRLFEDYSLFLRLWLNGAKFYNMQEILLNFRVGTGLETIKRRSGVHYLKKEFQFLKFTKRINAFNNLDIIKYIILKFPIRLLPSNLVLIIYNKFLRRNKPYI